MHDTNPPGDPGAAKPRPRRLGRPPTLDREAVLRAARDVIGERGFDRTRYADVAERASVPVTTLQHAFGSLQAMLLESVERATSEEIPLLRDATARSLGTPWDRLSEFITATVHSPHDPQSWNVWLELWRLAARDAEIGAHAGVVYAQWWEYVAELVELGKASGQFSGPLVADPLVAAQAIVGLIDGLAAAIVMRADDPRHDRVESVARDAVAVMVGLEGAIDGERPDAASRASDADPELVDRPPEEDRAAA